MVAASFDEISNIKNIEIITLFLKILRKKSFFGDSSDFRLSPESIYNLKKSLSVKLFLIIR